MSEDRSRGIYHSLIGKPSLRVVLVMGLLMGLCSLLLLAACGGEESAKGAAGQEHKKSKSGGTASTDGLIAFRRYLDLDLTRSAIFTMYPNGSHIRQITHPPEGWSDDSPVWSPDGTKVAFNREAIDESTSRIMVLNTKTGGARQVQVVRGVERSDPAFSPDGHSLAFKRSDGIWIVGLDGSNPHRVTYEYKWETLEFEDSGPAFSPDGKRVVFVRVRLDDSSAVFVKSLDSIGSPESQITPWEMGCGGYGGPEFSPKGDLVLFSCTPEGGSSNLYWVHPNGTDLEQLTHTDADKHYVGSSFSPEFDDEGWGDIVAARYPAYGDEGNSDVLHMHVDTGGVVPSVTGNLTKSETLDDAPSWGTHPPSLKTLWGRGCDAPPKEAPKWCFKG
jgi:Tol biopolymer transport system component